MHFDSWGSPREAHQPCSISSFSRSSHSVKDWSFKRNDAHVCSVMVLLVLKSLPCWCSSAVGIVQAAAGREVTGEQASGGTEAQDNA